MYPLLSPKVPNSAGNVSNGYDVGLLVLSHNASATPVKLNDAGVDGIDLSPPNAPPAGSNLTIIGCARTDIMPSAHFGLSSDYRYASGATVVAFTSLCSM